MIKIRKLSKSFRGSGFTIECPELDVANGTIAGVYGTVSSGKTLFSKIISGLLKKYNGSIEIGPYDLSLLPKRYISYIPTGNILYNDLRFSDHINFYSSQYMISMSEVEAKIKWFNQFFPTERLKSKKIYDLTSGELQYIKIFLSLIHSPSVMIADEIFEGLGSSDVDILKNLFSDLNSREVTILFTTSHKEYMDQLTENRSKIDSGKILQL